MTGVTHCLGGIAAALILLEGQAVSGNMESAIVLSGAVLGSLLPDIDTVHSSISHRLPVVSWIVWICQKITRAVSWIFPGRLGKNIRSMAGHRGIFHSCFLPAIVLFVNCFQKGQYEIFLTGLLLGILSHMLLDALSGGVPVFMPFTTKRLKLAGLHTGGLMEKLVGIGLLITIGSVLL